MAASAADIATVKALVWGRGVTVPAAYTDTVIATAIERHPLSNYVTVRTGEVQGMSFTQGYYVEPGDADWVPEYELHLAAADLLDELASGTVSTSASLGLGRVSVDGFSYDNGHRDTITSYADKASQLRRKARRPAVSIGI